MREYPERPIVGVGAVVLDGSRVVLVKRANEPLKGEWSLPGGAVDVGETLEQAIRREVREETGLDVEVGPIVDVLDRIRHDADGRIKFHYVLVEFLCRPIGGELRCASDAEDAVWAADPDLVRYAVAEATIGVIEKGDRARRHGLDGAQNSLGVSLRRGFCAQPRRRLATVERVHERREPAEARARRRSRRPRLRAQIRRRRSSSGASSASCTTSTTNGGRRPRIILFEAVRFWRLQGYPEWVRRAILSHADYSGVPRESLLEKTLFACDEMAGFITAASLVRPSRSVLDLEASSVVKRMKDKAFARGVKRDDLRAGADVLGLPLDEHIANVIASLREQADALGLRGTL